MYLQNEFLDETFAEPKQNEYFIITTTKKELFYFVMVILNLDEALKILKQLVYIEEVK